MVEIQRLIWDYTNYKYLNFWFASAEEFFIDVQAESNRIGTSHWTFEGDFMQGSITSS